MAEAKFYDQGWIARANNEPFRADATLDWKDGWRDANEVDDKTRADGVRSLTSVA